MQLLWSIKKILSKENKYTLVISGWGTKWFYGLGILKWLEELGYKDKIQAIYGVSAWAILASYRAAWYSAEEIFTIFFNSRPFGFRSINIFSKKSLLKTDFFNAQFTKDLPATMNKLYPKVYIWTTDTKMGKFVLFDEGDLVPILLGSMAIPWIFPVVPYTHHTLMDWGATNNFPVSIAKKKYPNNEIIGIALNKFTEQQTVKNIFDTISVSFEILLRHSTLEHMHLVDHVFYKQLPLKVLSTSKKHMRQAYVEGYKDCIEHFKK